jgi:hypothetical protein
MVLGIGALLLLLKLAWEKFSNRDRNHYRGNHQAKYPQN